MVNINGIISKIANSRLGQAVAIGAGAGTAFVPTYQMLNPPAVYAHDTGDYLSEIVYLHKQKAHEVIDKIIKPAGYEHLIRVSLYNEALLTKDEYILAHLNTMELLDYITVLAASDKVGGISKAYAEHLLNRIGEVKGLNKKFDSFDVNGDGIISKLDDINNDSRITDLDKQLYQQNQKKPPLTKRNK